ncbi:alginate export family protein, partial [Klebsiella pneumoniae]|nr:alginate export family protein [Klebsiella pneumoniae]
IRRDGMHVYNLRALNGKLPGLDALTLNGEYAVQRGSGDGVDYDAKAWYAQADYAFETLPLTPVLGYRYAVFSGDDDVTD